MGANHTLISTSQLQLKSLLRGLDETPRAKFFLPLANAYVAEVVIQGMR